jgi:transcriptional regulator with XRE-family HTH domain
MSMHTVFGTQLRKERNKQHLTAETVAEACNISRSYITLIESGVRLPGKKLIPKIATALRIKTGTVLNWYLEDITQKIRKGIKI